MTTAAPVQFTTPPASRLLGVGLLLIVAFVWGSMFVVVKTLTPTLTAAELMAWRYMLAALLLLPLLCRPQTAGLWRHGAALGTLLFLAVGTQTAGLAYTTASRAAFITGLTVVMVPLAAAFLARQRVAGAVWVGAGLCLLGLTSLSFEGSPLNAGDGLVLGTTVAYTAYVLVMGRAAAQHAALPLTAVSILTTAGLSALWMGAQAVMTATPIHVPPSGTWAGLAFLSLIGTIGMYVLQAQGQRLVSASETAVVFSFEPVFALLTAVVVLRESIGLRGVVGVALIMAGLLYSQLRGVVKARQRQGGLSPQAAER